MERIAIKFNLLVMAMLVGLLLGCSSGSSTPDGDWDTEDLADLTDELPAVCVGVDCGPGECRVADGEAYCYCPEGYHQVGKVHCVADTIDGDDDLELEPEPEMDEEEETAFDEYELPILPNCDETDGETFPCYTDLDYTELNDEGLFRIANEPNWSFSIPHDVHRDWFAASIKPWEDAQGRAWGGYLVHLPTHRAMIVGDKKHALSFYRISDNGVSWGEAIDGWGYISHMSFSNFISKKMVIGYEWRSLFAFEQSGHFYWSEIIADNLNAPLHLFTFNAQGDKKRLDSLGLERDYGVMNFVVSDKYIAYQQLNERIIYIDRSTLEEHIVDDAPYLTDDVALWGDKVYWSDATDAAVKGLKCGFSVMEYDILTQTRRTVVDGTQVPEGSTGEDKQIGDVWENWLAYTDFGRSEAEETCRIANGRYYGGEIILHHLPTGLEWEITDNAGDDEIVRMWGRWMVWRHQWYSIYGMDLCKHPELKYYINQCPTYTGEPTLKTKKTK